MHCSPRSRCALAVVAGLLVTAAPVSRAAVVTRTVNAHLRATPDGPDNTYALDVNLDGVTDFTFTTLIGIPEDPTFASFATIDHPFASINANVIDAATGDGFPTISRLAAGAVVGPASTFSGGNDQGNLFFIATPDAATGDFQNASGYVGFRFASGADTLYGYAYVTVNDLLDPADPLGVTIGQVGFETAANAPITLPPVPEPAAVTILGVVALFAQRRRRSSTRSRS